MLFAHAVIRPETTLAVAAFGVAGTERQEGMTALRPADLAATRERIVDVAAAGAAAGQAGAGRTAVEVVAAFLPGRAAAVVADGGAGRATDIRVRPGVANAGAGLVVAADLPRLEANRTAAETGTELLAAWFDRFRSAWRDLGLVDDERAGGRGGPETEQPFEHLPAAPGSSQSLDQGGDRHPAAGPPADDLETRMSRISTGVLPPAR